MTGSRRARGGSTHVEQPLDLLASALHREQRGVRELRENLHPEFDGEGVAPILAGDRVVLVLLLVLRRSTGHSAVVEVDVRRRRSVVLFWVLPTSLTSLDCPVETVQGQQSEYDTMARNDTIFDIEEPSFQSSSPPHHFPFSLDSCRTKLTSARIYRLRNCVYRA